MDNPHFVPVEVERAAVERRRRARQARLCAVAKTLNPLSENLLADGIGVADSQIVKHGDNDVLVPAKCVVCDEDGCVQDDGQGLDAALHLRNPLLKMPIFRVLHRGLLRVWRGVESCRAGRVARQHPNPIRNRAMRCPDIASGAAASDPKPEPAEPRMKPRSRPPVREKKEKVA